MQGPDDDVLTDGMGMSKLVARRVRKGVVSSVTLVENLGFPRKGKLSGLSCERKTKPVRLYQVTNALSFVQFYVLVDFDFILT